MGRVHVHRQGLPRLRFLHYQEQRTRWTAAERRDVCDAQACHAHAWVNWGPSPPLWFPSPCPDALAARTLVEALVRDESVNHRSCASRRNDTLASDRYPRVMASFPPPPPLHVERDVEATEGLGVLR